MVQSPRLVAISSSVLRHGGIVLLALSSLTAQSRILKPAQQTTSNPGQRRHVGIFRSSDYQERLLVAFSSDRWLNGKADSAQTNAIWNDARTNSFSPAPLTRNANELAGLTPTSTIPGGTPAATPTAKESLTAPTAPVKAAKMSPTASPVTTTTQAQTDFWARVKERGHDWLLLAQLNPIPVAVGAVILIVLIGLLLVKRRRAKGPKPVGRALLETKKNTKSVARATSKPIAQPPPAVGAPFAGAASLADPAIDSAPQTTSPVVPISATVEDNRRELVNHVAAEAKKLFDGADYDRAIIGSEERDTRRLVGAELLSALVGRNPTRRERAREAFLKYGYFEDAARDLRAAESDNERAAAARRLSFVHDRKATPHLIGALSDPSPDVRRASVEALIDLRDPAAIGPLNSLLQTENDRKVPRTLIKQAIEACATSAPESMTTLPTPESFSNPATESIETEREVIEI